MTVLDSIVGADSRLHVSKILRFQKSLGFDILSVFVIIIMINCEQLFVRDLASSIFTEDTYSQLC